MQKNIHYYGKSTTRIIYLLNKIIGHWDFFAQKIEIHYNDIHYIKVPRYFGYKEIIHLKSEQEKTAHIKKLTIDKNSTMFVPTSWNLVKMITWWGNNFTNFH